MVRKENNVMENEARRQSKKDAMSRCSSTYFRKVMNKLEPKVNDKQRARIMSTPFGRWLKMPKLSIYSTRVDVILKSFNSDSSSFIFGKNIVVPFTSFEFSIVLGLPYGGQPINQDLRTKSIFLSSYFAGKHSNATRKIISRNLLLLVESDDESHLDDFVRMFILFSLNCIVFPLSTYMTPRFVFSYIDDLSNFFGYSWGETAHRFLCDKIAAYLGDSKGMVGRKTYLDGCVVGMMAWVYEKVPSLGVVSGSPRMFPRLFKWGENKIPLKFKDAEALLTKITRTKVYNIIPFGEELKLITKRQRNTKEDTRCKVRSSEKLVKGQLHEIKILRQIRCQIDGMRTNDVGVRVNGELDDKKNNGKNVLFADERENFDKDLGGDNNLHDVDVVADFIEGDGVGCTKLDVEGNKVGTKDSSRDVDESDDAGGVIGSQVDTVSNVVSSVVNNVMTRFDSVKKRKSNIFVTPPNSTSRRKTKSIVEAIDFIVISDKGDTKEDQQLSDDKVELELTKYRGREDFCGCEEVSYEDREIIMDYLTREKLGGTIWEGERYKICGPQLCDLLFGNVLRDNIINCYMQIMRGYSRKNGFEIFCMDTTVQDEVLGALWGLNRKWMLKDDGYHDFLSHLTNESRGKLEVLNRNLMEHCRFLLFPIHSKSHWFLLVYKTEERKFELRNSIYTSMALEIARAYAKFLVGYMRVMSSYDMGEYVNRVFCQQPGADLDCGVYTCLWMECYAREDDGMWTYERCSTMKSVRARIAATILSDNNGLFNKKS